jgi:signal transduction histidine kinase
VVLNHFVATDGVKHLTAFTWEDRFLAEFACELISVLIYQMLRNQDHESDYERLIHGARTSLESARANLQTLEDRQVDRHLAPEDGYLVPDAIDWIEDLESQINRDELVGRSDLEVGPVSLYGDVLAKIGPMVRRMRTRAHNPTFSLVGFEKLAENYRSLPRVQGNPKALDCIFRNLIDNSMKYCRTDEGVNATVEISATVNRARGVVLVTVADNGIGIDDEERDLIFESGFRGKRATGRATQGVGRGLFECRLLLKRLGGEIELGKGEQGASFTIVLPSVATGVVV